MQLSACACSGQKGASDPLALELRLVRAAPCRCWEPSPRPLLCISPSLFLLFIILRLFISVCTCLCALSFHHVDPRNLMQVSGLDSKCLYPLRHLSQINVCFLTWAFCVAIFIF